MKRVMILAVAVIGFTSVPNASMKHKSNRYVNGDYKGYWTQSTL